MHLIPVTLFRIFEISKDHAAYTGFLSAFVSKMAWRKAPSVALSLISASCEKGINSHLIAFLQRFYSVPAAIL
jgi:hypothetical protein